MRYLGDTLWIETRKALRSRLPLFTLIGLMILPLAAAFFLVVLKDPQYALKAGLISAKAHLAGSTADWPTFFLIFGQGIGVGGVIIFSVIISWVFGREFTDGTVKDMLAVPVPRLEILLAKFIVIAAWSAGLTVVVSAVGLGLASLVGLPPVDQAVIVQGVVTVAVTVLMVVVVDTPVAFFASFGRGYLAGIGAALAMIALANIVAVAGWGAYFPWSVPGVYAGGGQASLGAISYALVALTGLAGAGGTYLWWQRADQNR